MISKKILKVAAITFFASIQVGPMLADIMDVYVHINKDTRMGGFPSVTTDTLDITIPITVGDLKDLIAKKYNVPRSIVSIKETILLVDGSIVTEDMQKKQYAKNIKSRRDYEGWGTHKVDTVKMELQDSDILTKKKGKNNLLVGQHNANNMYAREIDVYIKN